MGSQERKGLREVASLQRLDHCLSVRKISRTVLRNFPSRQFGWVDKDNINNIGVAEK